MAPHPSYKQNIMVLPASRTITDIPDMPIPICIANRSRKPKYLAKEILVGVGTNVPEPIFPLEESASFLPLKKGRTRISLSHIPMHLNSKTLRNPKTTR